MAENKKKRKKYFVNHFSTPYMLFADKDGNIYDHPEYLMAGMSYDECIVPSPEELVDIPYNSKLFFLPETKPIGYDPLAEEFVVVDAAIIDGKEIECFAVSAFMQPGYARLYLPAADYEDKTIKLPLWSYTAVGVDEKGNLKVAAFQVENNYKWDPKNYDDRQLVPLIEKWEKEHPENRLLIHLKRCAMEYHCFAAKNLFLRRWEAPLPVSRTCNSRCLGCLSLQEKCGMKASHDRIGFQPTPEEIAELAIPHLNLAEESMVSFGQGCEGEPLTEADLIEKAILMIRKQTQAGSINLNTNGSMPHKLERLINAGLNSVRISMNSVLPAVYKAYFKPVNYTFEDVIESLRLSGKKGIFTMINYLIFPGVNDTEEEYEALKALIKDTGVNFIHFKNLCIDPEVYIEQVGRGEGKNLGLRGLFELLRNEFPHVEIGYFNKNIGKFVGYD